MEFNFCKITATFQPELLSIPPDSFCTKIIATNQIITCNDLNSYLHAMSKQCWVDIKVREVKFRIEKAYK